MSQSQLDACNGLGDGAACTADTAPGLCRDGVCLPPTCGDGFATDGEECDGSDLGSASDCTSLQYYDPSPLKCKADCTYDRSQCLGYCGDGMVDPRYEVCDGGPPAETCLDLGYGAGTLGCRQCGPALENCRYFGWHQPVITPHIIFDVSAVDDTHVYAVGVHGVVYQFDGNGWAPIDISACFSTFDMSELDSVHALAADDVWIGGQDFMTNDAIAIHITKTGCVKTAVTSSAEVKQIFAVSDTDVYAAVQTSLYHFDGMAWMMVDANPAQYVWASGSDDVYAAAYNGTSLRHLSGGTWQTESLPGSPVVASIWGRGTNDVYVGGEASTALASPSVLLHWTGSGWVSTSPMQNAANPVTSAITSIGISNNRLFIATEPNTSRVYEFDGTTWSDVGMPTHGGIPGRIALTASGKMYATEGLAFLHRYEGTGLSSFALTTGLATRAIASAANNAYSIDGSSDLETWDGLSETRDTGTTNISDIWLDPAGTVYAVQSTGGLRKRTAPNTWADVDASANGSRMWGIADNDIWTIDNTKHVFQHWNGASTSVCPSCTVLGTISIYDLWGSSSTDVFAVGDIGYLWHWDGTKWSVMTSNTTATLYKVFGWASNDVVAVGYSGTVIHYDGTSWSHLDLPVLSTLNTVWGTSFHDLFVADGTNIYRYDGTRWSPVDSTSAGGGVYTITGAGDTIFVIGFKFVRLLRTIGW